MLRRAQVYLASSSPRRSELLRQIGVRFQTLNIAVNETALPNETPDAYVARLAALKANAGWDSLAERERLPVLGADTIVSSGGIMFGKPTGPDEALRALLELAGRTHRVITGVALRSAAGVAIRLSRSEVTFRTIERAEAVEYWSTGEPADKAGGYAIQGFGAIFVKSMLGSYSGVMGLPLFETAELLTEAHVPPWQRT